MDRRPAALAVVLALAACASAPTPEGPALALYQHAGSRQCERGGRTLEALKAELAAAGIPVRSAACGHDGRMYAQSCGMPDGRILVVHVPPDKAAAAAALGLEPLRDLPEAKTAPCR